LDPTDRGVCAHMQWKMQTRSAEPQPHASRRTALCEAGEDRADRRHDGLVGMKQNLTVGLTPHEAYRQAGRLAIVLDLRGTRLAKIDNRLTREMRWCDLRTLIHGRSPSPERRPACGR